MTGFSKDFHFISVNLKKSFLQTCSLILTKRLRTRFVLQCCLNTAGNSLNPVVYSLKITRQNLFEWHLEQYRTGLYLYLYLFKWPLETYTCIELNFTDQYYMNSSNVCWPVSLKEINWRSNLLLFLCCKCIAPFSSPFNVTTCQYW